MTKRQVVQVVAQRELAPSHYRLTLRAPAIAAAARAGQFVHLLPRTGTSTDPLLRRAFSVASIHSDGSGGEAIDIVYRVMGRGTSLLARLRPGDEVDVLGPLGVPFDTANSGPMLLVGGGVGVPPLSMLAEQTRREEGAALEPCEIVALLGARTKADLLCLDNFEADRVRTSIATDDGSAGKKCLVTELLREELDRAVSAQLAPTVFTCGPTPMLRAVAALCREREVPCQVSLEESMPCGVGVCNGCVVAVQGAGDDYGRYRRICVEGPVMAATDIDW